MTQPIGANSRYHLQCITSLTSDSAPSFLLVFEDARYMFNCGENTTRALTQDRISTKKLKNVFLSDVGDPRVSSGLGGLILSTGERAGSELSVYGPEGVDHFLASMRYHTRRDKLSLGVHSVPRLTSGQDGSDSDILVQDKNITVYGFSHAPEASTSNGVGLGKRNEPASRRSTSPPRKQRRSSASPPPSRTTQNSEDGTTRPQNPPQDLDPFARNFSPSQLSGIPASEWRSLVLQDMFRGGKPAFAQPANSPGPPNKRPIWYSSPAWNTSGLPRFASPSFAVSYLVIGPAVRGRFKPDKAKAQGVSAGQDFGRLQKGETITLADGTTVAPESVYEPGSPPAAFAFVACPSPGYIASLTASNLFDQKCKAASARLQYAFHNLGAGVLEDERYQQWLSTFPTDVQHIIASPETSPDRITFASATLLQLRMSYLDPEMFKLPTYDLSAPSLPDFLPNARSLLAGDMFPLNGAVVTENARLRTFDFAVPSEESSKAASLLNSKTEQTTSHSEQAWAEYQELILKVKKDVDAKEARRAESSEKIPGAEIRVTSLGTGSAMPSKYRNVSSTLLELPNGQAILLDAGEGTYGQLARHFGSKCDDLLRRLVMVFISHMHADHHGGLANVLVARNKAGPTQRLYIAGPGQVRTYLEDLSDLMKLGLKNTFGEVYFIDNNVLLADKRDDARQVGLYKAIGGMKKVETVPVDHRARCFGLVLEGEDAWKIVFSGDTKPCQSLQDAGQGATLLIHEATIEDDMPEVALAKGHSTFGQAIEVARQMKAKCCLLTHFSQRYPKLPPLQEPKGDDKNSCDIAVAFDLMSVKIGDLWKAKLYAEALQVLFSEWEGDEEATEATVGNEVAQNGKPKKEKAPKQGKKEKQQKAPANE